MLIYGPTLDEMLHPETIDPALRKRAREGVLDHEEGLRLLDQAAEHTQQAMSCMEELTLAAHELAVKAKG